MQSEHCLLLSIFLENNTIVCLGLTITKEKEKFKYFKVSLLKGITEKFIGNRIVASILNSSTIITNQGYICETGKDTKH